MKQKILLNNNSGIELQSPVSGNKYSIFLNSSSTLLNGLVSYWKLDESSGSVVDSVGGFNGTNDGLTQGDTGKINNGVSGNNRRVESYCCYI
jgi:hypothetical protein